MTTKRLQYNSKVVYERASRSAQKKLTQKQKRKSFSLSDAPHWMSNAHGFTQIRRIHTDFKN